jgi:hypothetical protein
MFKLFAASIRYGSLACILGGLALMGAPPARADECKGSGEDRICLHGLGPDPNFIQFSVSIARGAYSHFNVREGLKQWEVPAVGGKSNRSRGTKVRAREGSKYKVSAQACIRGFVGPSFCSPWQVFTVTMEAKSDRSAPDSKNLWAAIATDSKGRWGWAHSEPSETGARTKAMGGCGPACKVVNTARNRCLAYAKSPTNQWGTSIGDTINYVRTHALSGCAESAPPGTCKVVHSVCG